MIAHQDEQTKRSITPLTYSSRDETYQLSVSPDLCVGLPGNIFLFGGAGLASAITAMEEDCGRRLICATAQYISYARSGDALDICTQTAANGKQITQMQARVRKGDETIIMVTAALGDREDWPEAQWTPSPDMLPPNQCDEWPIWPAQAGGLLERLEVRLEPSEIERLAQQAGVQQHGRLRYWLRPRDDMKIDAAFLAIAADFIPSGAAAAFGRLGGGNSLDNVLRIGALVPTNWLKCEIEMDFAQRGFASGVIKIYADNGQLVATGSQSLILRFLDA